MNSPIKPFTGIPEFRSTVLPMRSYRIHNGKRFRVKGVSSLLIGIAPRVTHSNSYSKGIRYVE